MAKLYQRHAPSQLEQASARIAELEKYLRLALEWMEGASRPPRHITDPAAATLEEGNHGVVQR